MARFSHKRKLAGLLIILLAGGALASCEQAPTLSEAEKASIVASVRQTMIEYYAAVRARGLEAEFDYLDRSQDFFWVPPGYSAAISYDSVATVLRQHAPLFRSIVNTPDSLRIVPLGPALAAYSVKLRSKVTDTAGGTTITVLIETGIFIKRADGWKLLSGQTAVVH